MASMYADGVGRVTASVLARATLAAGAVNATAAGEAVAAALTADKVLASHMADALEAASARSPCAIVHVVMGAARQHAKGMGLAAQHAFSTALSAQRLHHRLAMCG